MRTPVGVRLFLSGAVRANYGTVAWMVLQQYPAIFVVGNSLEGDSS